MIKAAVVGIVGAVVAVAITLLIGDAVSGPLMVTPPGGDAPEEVAMAAALSSTVIGGIVGLGLAALCKRFVTRSAAAFLGICIVGLVVYGAFTFTAVETTSTGVWLNIMHVAAAIPIVGSLMRMLPASKM